MSQAPIRLDDPPQSAPGKANNATADLGRRLAEAPGPNPRQTTPDLPSGLGRQESQDRNPGLLLGVRWVRIGGGEPLHGHCLSAVPVPV